jgi:polysaccharide export outer membrane protein
MSWLGFWRCLGAPLVVFLLLGTAGEVGAQEGSVSRSYRIGPRDEIQIRVAELPDLNTEQVVAEDGTIVLPVIGTVAARGLTEDQLAVRLRARLEDEGLRRATVSVSVTAYRSRPVSIMGAVAEPGNHFVPGRATLLEVLLNAGGLNPDHGESIFVRRRAENGLADQLEIPVRELIEVGNPALNIPILAGDQINVPAAKEITVHLLGEVQKSGSLTFRSTERVTLLTAIAAAGGLSETASKKIRIKRRTGDDEEELVADFRRVLDGDDPDPVLRDGDLIIVKESFF